MVMGALDGIKVLEAGLLVQGPQAAAMLSDWGADVVKIELPGFGDQSRWIPAGPGDGRAPFFIACNRGKRSITIDLRRPEGRDVFLRLVEQADVFISNFKSGTLDEWGLSYDEVAARNPRIIYAAATSFGTVGADAGKEGADLSGQAAGGLISTTGSSGEPVTPVAVTITDHIGCLNLVGGITARRRTRRPFWQRGPTPFRGSPPRTTSRRHRYRHARTSAWCWRPPTRCSTHRAGTRSRRSRR